MTAEMIRHNKPIDSVCYPDDSAITVGILGVTAIEPYYENGEMAGVVWFNIWKGEFLWQKINSKHVAVVAYKKEE